MKRASIIQCAEVLKYNDQTCCCAVCRDTHARNPAVDTMPGCAAITFALPVPSSAFTPPELHGRSLCLRFIAQACYEYFFSFPRYPNPWCVEQRPLRAPEAPSRECRARGGVLCIARGSDDLRCMFCHTADMHADFGMRLCWCLGRHGGAAVLRHQVRASPPHLLHASPVLLHSTHPVCGFCSIRSPPGTSCHSTPRPSSDSTFTRARTALTTAPTSAATATRR